MIEAKDMSLTYADGTMALKNINLQIETGELIYVTGPSGSGKTSLIKLCMGMEYPTSGSLQVLDTPIRREQAANIRLLRMKIGPVFQEFKLIRGRTAMENVILGMRFLDFQPGQIKEMAGSALARVGLAGKARALVENMSWGECQRVAIARAVARKPALILADEPTGNLDHDNAVSILELLTSCRDRQTTVIITTHATHLIDGTKSARIIRMQDGLLAWNKAGIN